MQYDIARSGSFADLPPVVPEARLDLGDDREHSRLRLLGRAKHLAVARVGAPAVERTVPPTGQGQRRIAETAFPRRSRDARKLALRTRDCNDLHQVGAIDRIPMATNSERQR